MSSNLNVLCLINEIEAKHQYTRISLTRESKSVFHLRVTISRVKIDEFFFTEKFYSQEELTSFLIDLLMLEDLYLFQLEKEIATKSSVVEHYKGMVESAQQELENLKLRNT